MARTWREDLVINKSYSDHIYVFFPEEAKVGVKTVKTYANRMNSENAFRTILESVVSLKKWNGMSLAYAHVKRLRVEVRFDYEINV
ncbi:hypothetical protein AHAS_Ahas11G0083400 [Arachis hypogaea]